MEAFGRVPSIAQGLTSSGEAKTTNPGEVQTNDQKTDGCSSEIGTKKQSQGANTQCDRDGAGSGKSGGEQANKAASSLIQEGDSNSRTALDFTPLTQENLRASEQQEEDTKDVNMPGSQSIGRVEPSNNENKGGSNRDNGSSNDDLHTSTSTTMSEIEISCLRSNILPLDQECPDVPSNLANLRARLARRRKSVGATQSDYHNFVLRATGHAEMAPEDGDFDSALFKKFDEEEKDQGYKRESHRGFLGFPELAGFNDNLPLLRPVFVEGLELIRFAGVPMSALIDGAVPYDDHNTMDEHSMVLPHIAGQFGPEDNNAREWQRASRRCAHLGATLMYARQCALQYLGETVPLSGATSEARVITFAMGGADIHFYAHDVRRGGDDNSVVTSEKKKEEEEEFFYWRQFSLGRVNVETYEGFVMARTMVRNAQDFAFEEALVLRDRIKGHWGRKVELVMDEEEEEEEDEGEDDEGVVEPDEVRGGEEDDDLLVCW